MLHANLPEDKEPDINPQLSDAIKSLRAYFPVELRDQKNPDQNPRGGFSQCRFVDLPANQPDEKVAENKVDAALLENKGTRLAILDPVPFEVYKARKVREEKDPGAIQKTDEVYRADYKKRQRSNNRNMANAIRIYRELAKKDKPTYSAFPTHSPEDKKYDPADDEKEIEHPQYQEKMTSSFSRFLYIGDHGRVALAANGGDLNTWLRKNNHTKITEDEFKENVAQLFIAVDRLHGENKIHRDIKPLNILVYVRKATADQPRRIHLELADLDTTVDVSQKNMGLGGTPGYLAPECMVPVVEGQPELRWDASAYQKAEKKPLDYYTTGLVLNDMLCSYYNNHNPVPEDDRLTALFDGLTHKNSAQRMSISQAMESSYFGATPEERERYFSGVKQRHEQQDSWQYSYPEPNDTFQIHSGDLQLLHFEAVSLNMQMKDMKEHPHHFEDDVIISVLNEKIQNLNQFILNVKTKVENNAELTGILNEINSGVVVARQQMDEGVRKSYRNYFSNESIDDDNRLFRLLTKRTDKQKRYDFRAALSSLDLYINTLEKSADKKELGTLLKIYRTEIAKEASNVPVRELPRLTENIQRWLFKVKNPDHPANGLEGVNTLRGKECSEKISSFQWGKLIGGIGLLVFGGILVTAAVMTLMASFGAATPLSAALGYIGVNVSAAAITTVIGVTSVSTVAASAGLSVAISGAGKIGTSLYNKYDKAFGKRTTQRLFDHPIEENKQEVRADHPVAAGRIVRERK